MTCGYQVMIAALYMYWAWSMPEHMVSKKMATGNSQSQSQQVAQALATLAGALSSSSSQPQSTSQSTRPPQVTGTPTRAQETR